MLKTKLGNIGDKVWICTECDTQRIAGLKKCPNCKGILYKELVLTRSDTYIAIE